MVFAAVYSKDGGARMLFRLGEIGLVKIIIGPSVLREAEEVVRRKAPSSLPELAKLLAAADVLPGEKPKEKLLSKASKMIEYTADALILAEAWQAQPTWFVTLDRKHFLNNKALQGLPFLVGTPGDAIQSLSNINFTDN